MRSTAWLVAVLTLCVSCSTIGAQTTPSAGLGAGAQMFPVAQRPAVPPLHGVTITGTAIDLADELGHGPVAINVWASWCGPCRREMPLLVHAAGARVRVLGIDERDITGSARAFAASRGATYPSFSDPDGELLARLPMLPQTGVPSTLFLDRRGRVAARVVGPVDARTLRRILRRLGGDS